MSTTKKQLSLETGSPCSTPGTTNPFGTVMRVMARKIAKRCSSFRCLNMKLARTAALMRASSASVLGRWPEAVERRRAFAPRSGLPDLSSFAPGAAPSPKVSPPSPAAASSSNFPAASSWASCSCQSSISSFILRDERRRAETRWLPPTWSSAAASPLLPSPAAAPVAPAAALALPRRL